jgi:hypothetical protein
MFPAAIIRSAYGTATRTAASASLGKAYVHRKQEHQDRGENGDKLPCGHGQDNITSSSGWSMYQCAPTIEKFNVAQEKRKPFKNDAADLPSVQGGKFNTLKGCRSFFKNF